MLRIIVFDLKMASNQYETMTEALMTFFDDIGFDPDDYQSRVTSKSMMYTAMLGRKIKLVYDPSLTNEMALNIVSAQLHKKDSMVDQTIVTWEEQQLKTEGSPSPS